MAKTSGASNTFTTDNYTDKQREALELCRSPATRILLRGGSRSGKTFFIVSLIFVRAMLYPGSRHLIARLRYSHARVSLWLDTIPAVIEAMGISPICTPHEQDRYYTVETDHGTSEVWLDGLDDKERVDKVLGREYNTIFINEISQIAYDTVTTLLTRLALNIEGCVNRLYLDCNPPSKRHWSYKLFIMGVDPDTGEDLDNPSEYATLQVNPDDNRENLPDGYIETTLATLPESKRRRFYLGEYGDTEGTVFTDWDIVEDVPDEFRRHCRSSYGLDFGFSVDPAALVWIGVNGNDGYIDELIYETGLTNQQLGERIKRLGVTDVIRADSSEPKSIRELAQMGISVKGAEKGPDSVRYGIDWMQSIQWHVTKRSTNVITEMQEYQWQTDNEGKSTGKPVDDWNHAIDAIRYAGEAMRARKQFFVGRAYETIRT